MKGLDRVVRKYGILCGSIGLVSLSILLKMHSSKDYWMLKTPNELRPYIERGVIKRVYVITPDPEKEYIRKIGQGVFSIGWLGISIFILVELIRNVKWESVKQPDNKKNEGNKDKGINDKKPTPELSKEIQDIKVFLHKHYILIILFNNLQYSNVSPLLGLLVRLLKDMQFYVSYGEVNRPVEGDPFGSSNPLIKPDFYIGGKLETTGSRIGRISAEVSRFREERDGRIGKGKKEGLIIHDINRIIALDEDPHKALSINLNRISNMGLQGYDMRLILTFSDKVEYFEPILKMGGNEVGVIELGGISKSHMILKSSEGQEKTVTIPSRDSILKYLNS